MRERAAKLRAHVDVWSKPGAGTEVAQRRTRSWRDVLHLFSA
jgi:nitrate/nitrite-specific signal transduction histidine kinase